MRYLATFYLWSVALCGFARADGLHDWAYYLQSLALRYNASAQLPGETKSMAMDCSNTARFLVWKTRGVSLPRTASDQYLFVKRSGRLKRAGGLFGGTPDTSWWTKRLQPGDLLFWEHTYKPKRKPPVTHVMVYLGPDENGVPLMAGAQNSRGVNIYKLQPRVAYGGHGGFLGLFKKKGKLVAYGRLPSGKEEGKRKIEECRTKGGQRRRLFFLCDSGGGLGLVRNACHGEQRKHGCDFLVVHHDR